MTRYQLTIRVECLPKVSAAMGMMKRKPNSYAIVTVTGGNRNGLCLGKTDIVTTQQNPYYCKIIVLETTASEYLPIKVHIFDHAMHYAMDYSAAGTTTYDNDALKRPYNRYDLEIAAANFEITEIVQSPGRLMCQSSINNDKIKIYASVEESIKGNPICAANRLQLHIRGLELKNITPGIMGLDRSDPYYEIVRKNYDHTAGIVHWNVVYRSESIENHLNPYWMPIAPLLSLEEVCFCDVTWPLKIIVYTKYKNSGRLLPIGEVETTVQDILQHIAVRGNADRVQALRVHKVNKADGQIDYEKIRGYLVVLSAKIISNSSNADTNSPPEATTTTTTFGTNHNNNVYNLNNCRTSGPEPFQGGSTLSL